MKRSLCLGFDSTTFELRTEDGSQFLTGLAIPYEQWSQPIYGWFKEKFARSAFAEYLATKPDIYCCVEHDMNKILGRSISDTLTLTEKDDGMYIRCAIPNTTYALDLVENVKNKNIRGMSFIFDPIDEDWGKEDGKEFRYIKKAKLYETCFTANPAYQQTTAGLRSNIHSEAELRELIASKNQTKLSNLYDARVRMLSWK